jgi:hypothetical protein
VTVRSLGIVHISLWDKKKIVSVPGVIPSLPWASRWISLLIAGIQIFLRAGSCCNFLYCVIISFVMGWTTPQQYSSMSMIGPVHCEPAAALKASICITWLMACKEMLTGRHVESMRVDRRGRVIACVFGADRRGRVVIHVFGEESRLTSGSIIMDAGHAGGVIGHGRLNKPGWRS